MDRQLILDKSDDSYLICPQNSQLISENEILFFSISKKDNANKIGIMNFETKKQILHAFVTNEIM
ncbi:MAG: hypothetical protein EAZ27_13350 [Cytophagales bacterium]|nr:MAG: hypothetical protein EAZ27_13350 [Cytophagales bacterium]